MTPTKGPPRSWGSEAGEYGEHPDHPNERSGRSNPLKEVATVYAGRILEAERAVLSAGWRDPFGLNKAVCDALLTGADFAEPKHRFQFAYLCTCAELNHAPSIQEALTLATTCGDVFLDLDDLDAVLWHTDALPSPMLPTLAETVGENSRNRDRAQACLREGVGIMVGQLAFDFDIIIRPREPIARKAVR